MSELKAYIATTADGTGLADYYLKSEADKVIAEKDKEIAELKKKLMPCLNGDCILTCGVVEKYGKENAELKADLAEKDKEIAELKDKCQMHDFFWEGCGFDKLGFKNSIAVREAFDRLEADKKLTDAILDERNAEIVELKKACNDKDDWCLHTLKENRHQKHKRCLAMAEWCEVTAMWCYQAANTLPKGFRATLYGKPVMIEPSRLFKRSARLDNWVDRWRKLAEKFKPNQSTAQ